MKNILTAFLAIIFMSASIGTVGADVISVRQQNNLSNFIKTKTYNNSFDDIGGHWAEEYIASAYEYGIIGGISDSLYDPESSLTVAQAIAIATRIHMNYKYPKTGYNVMIGYTKNMKSGGHWASPYITYAVNEGLIDDVWSSLLDNPVTRAETVKIWSRTLQPKDIKSVNNVNSLPNMNIQTTYSKEIILFYEAGILQGSTINGVQYSFNPTEALSRAEAATIFMKLVEADKRVSGRTYGEKTVRVFAGTGSSGFLNNTTKYASFTLPYGLTADKNGKVIVFDTYNNALRLINNGRVETITGKWVAEDENRFSQGLYLNGLLSESLFNRPTDGVYNETGDLFICDSENHVIRLIRNGSTFTFAGSTQGYADGTGSTAKFNTPMAVAIDKNGNLYVTDTINNCIRKIDVEGNVTTIAGIPGISGCTDGKASYSLFCNPSGIAVNENGTAIYVADTGNHIIRKIEKGNVTTLSGVISEIDADGDPMGGFQDGEAFEAMFNLPKGITLVDDILFVADSGNNAIRAVNENGQVFTVAGTGEPGDREGGMLTAEFNQPNGILWHKGVLYISDTTNNMIKTLKVDFSMFKEAGL